MNAKLRWLLMAPVLAISGCANSTVDSVMRFVVGAPQREEEKPSSQPPIVSRDIRPPTALTTATQPDYCVGFPDESCERIKAAVGAKTRPTYCVPGYALAENGLTQEQIRICSLSGTGARREYCFDRPKPRGKRNWVWQERGQFGYSRALSKSSQDSGVAAEPLVLFQYQGRQGQTYEFLSMSPPLILSCTEPCDFMKIFGGPPQVVPVPDGSILAALMADARNGWLNSERVCTSDPNYKPSF